MKKLLLSIFIISIGISSIFCAFLFVLIRVLYNLNKRIDQPTFYQKIIDIARANPVFSAIMPVFFMGVLFGIVIIILYIWIYVEKMSLSD